MSNSLKSQIIRLAYENPELRKHLLHLVAAKNMTPKEAYMLARQKGPSDETRKIACEDPQYAYEYALDVDRGPRDDTRAATLSDTVYALGYAENVDKGPRDDTRKAACKSAYSAYLYQRDVDKKFHPDTWEAVQGTRHADHYRMDVKVPSKYDKSSDKSFDEAIKGKRFKHPETGNKVLFKSLPAEEQTKIRKEWKNKK